MIEWRVTANVGLRRRHGGRSFVLLVAKRDERRTCFDQGRRAIELARLAHVGHRVVDARDHEVVRCLARDRELAAMEGRVTPIALCRVLGYAG